MTSSFLYGTLTVELEGRIDTTNAADIDKELFELVDANNPRKVILDASKLEYISSVGLRVVLKLKKTIDDTAVVNASLEIYDIFSMTGFTDIIEVRKVLREVSIEGCEIIGRGGHGTVYRLDGDTIVKVYNEGEPLDEIEREISYSKKAFVYGIPTAISFDVVKCGNCYGVVFELINADTFANRLCAVPEDFDSYSVKYSAVVNKLHTTKADPHIFSNIKELYNKWVDDMAKYYTPDEIKLLHDIVNSVPERESFVHGDIHPKNMMVQDGELLLIDMADLSYGHPIFDYAGIALTHVVSGRNDGKYTKAVIGIEAEPAARLFNNMIKANFPGRSEEELKHINDTIMSFAMFKYAIAPAVNKNQSDELNQRLLENTRKSFFPVAAKLIGAVDF